MITQLNPALPVITPKGKGLAHFIIDEGIESNLLWVCFQDDTGECWTFRNPEIRAQRNITHGRENISPFYKPEDVAFKPCFFKLKKSLIELIKDKDMDYSDWILLFEDLKKSMVEK